MLQLTNTGQYNVAKIDDGDWNERVAWRASPAINNYYQNHIVIRSIGNSLHFFVNDQLLATLTDVDRSEGAACLSVISSAKGKDNPVTVDFDNFNIEKIP